MIPSNLSKEPVLPKEALTPPLKIASPPSDISNCNAVIVELPSTPFNNISLLLLIDLITKSEETLLNLPNSVPSSFNLISAPLASSIISPSTSSVKSPDDKSISVPSIVMLSIVTPPSASKLVAETIPSVESPGETNEPNELVEVKELLMFPTTSNDENDALSAFCKNEPVSDSTTYEELSASIWCKSEPDANAVVSVVTFVNPAPSPTNKPNDAVEIIEPLTPPPRVKSSLPENNPKKEPLTLVASTPAVTPDNWEPSPIYAPNEAVELIEPLMFPNEPVSASTK